MTSILLLVFFEYISAAKTFLFVSTTDLGTPVEPLVNKIKASSFPKCSCSNLLFLYFDIEPKLLNCHCLLFYNYLIYLVIYLDYLSYFYLM